MQPVTIVLVLLVLIAVAVAVLTLLRRRRAGGVVGTTHGVGTDGEDGRS